MSGPSGRDRVLVAAGLASLLSLGMVRQEAPREVTDAPARLVSTARIAPANEPGTPIVIAGLVVGADGKTPAPGVIVYAYHTDADGFYRRTAQATDAGEREPRLRGWARTGANGRFEFSSIKPAPYPGRNVPSHVHLTAWGAGYPRQWFELEFQGDPLIATQHFTDNTADYLYIMPVARDREGILRSEVTIRLRTVTNFPSR
jgi:protocatechuate 3,4-dioxygenase beta subunit